MTKQLLILTAFATACSTSPKSGDWQYTSNNTSHINNGKYSNDQEYCRERGSERECFKEHCEGNTCTSEGNEEIKKTYLSFNQTDDNAKRIEEARALDVKNCDAGDVKACISVYYTYDTIENKQISLRSAPQGFLQNKICKRPGIICRFAEIDQVYPAPSGYDLNIRQELQDHNILEDAAGTNEEFRKLTKSPLIDLIVGQIKSDKKFLSNAKWKAWPTVRYPSKMKIDPAAGESFLLRNAEIHTMRRNDYKSYDANIVIREIVKR